MRKNVIASSSVNIKNKPSYRPPNKPDSKLRPMKIIWKFFYPFIRNKVKLGIG